MDMSNHTISINIRLSDIIYNDDGWWYVFVSGGKWKFHWPHLLMNLVAQFLEDLPWHQQMPRYPWRLEPCLLIQCVPIVPGTGGTWAKRLNPWDPLGAHLLRVWIGLGMEHGQDQSPTKSSRMTPTVSAIKIELLGSWNYSTIELETSLNVWQDMPGHVSLRQHSNHHHRRRHHGHHPHYHH